MIIRMNFSVTSWTCYIYPRSSTMCGVEDCGWIRHLGKKDTRCGLPVLTYPDCAQPNICIVIARAHTHTHVPTHARDHSYTHACIESPTDARIHARAHESRHSLIRVQRSPGGISSTLPRAPRFSPVSGSTHLRETRLLYLFGFLLSAP